MEFENSAKFITICKFVAIRNNKPSRFKTPTIIIWKNPWNLWEIIYFKS